MSVRCQCPHCGTLVSIYEKAIGHRIRCPFCEKLIEALPYEQAAAQPHAAHSGAEPPVLTATSPSAHEPGGQPSDTIGLVAIPNQRKPIIFREERKGQEAEMDMTPMVDVVFQLLIFFMLTVLLIVQKTVGEARLGRREANVLATGN